MSETTTTATKSIGWCYLESILEAQYFAVGDRSLISDDTSMGRPDLGGGGFKETVPISFVDTAKTLLQSCRVKEEGQG